MDFHFPSKRIHSPTDDYNTTTVMPARKKPNTDDMFTKMAGLSLAHSSNNDATQHSLNNNDSGGTWRKDLVERVDDIDQYLDGDENGTMQDDDTYIGTAPELVEVAMGSTILPFERIPGATGLRIPDFVLHGNGNNNNNAVDRAIYARKQLHQYHDPPPQTMDIDQHQPMDLD